MANSDRPKPVKCRTTPKMMARMITGIIHTGMPEAPILACRPLVMARGKLVTAWSPRTTNASPRYSARVPIVTASDGSPSTETRTPLSAPETAPRSRHRGMISSSDMPALHSAPKTQLTNPATLATDRSISPARMIRVMGRASRSMGIRSMSRNPVLRGEAKPVTAAEARAMLRRTATMIAASQLRRKPRRGAVSRTAAGRVVSASMFVVSSQAALGAQGQITVEGNGGQDEGADHGPLPERRDAQDRQRRGDGGEEDSTDGRSVHSAHAAGDGNTADDGCGHDVQLEALPRGRVEVAVLGGVDNAGQAGEGSGDGEGGEDLPSDADSVQPCGQDVRADGVELTP